MINDGKKILTALAAKLAVKYGNSFTERNVVHDMLLGLDKAFPDRSEFRHAEGNSTAHLKASVMGSSVTVIIAEIIEKGKLLLGTWQGVYFCEFDPPRSRKFYVKVVGE